MVRPGRLDVSRALSAMRSRLRPGGLVVVTMRDYDQALAERPPIAPPLVVAGPPRRVVVRLHEWDAPASRLYTVRFLILTEREDGWSVEHPMDHFADITVWSEQPRSPGEASWWRGRPAAVVT